MSEQRVWKAAGSLLLVATGLALWALLCGERRERIERTEEDEVERFRKLGAA